MKKNWIYIVSVALLGTSMFSSCDFTSSNNYMGTMAGAEIGGVVGEALGWMSTSRHDGPGKAMLGAVIGTVAGAAIGNSMTRDETTTSSKSSRNNKDYNYSNSYSSNSNGGYQTSGGYDSDTYSYNSKKVYSNLSISNVSYQDEDGNGKCSRNETLNIIYQVTNTGKQDIKDVVLAITSESGDKYFAVSPSNTVSLAAGETIRYKAKAFCKSIPNANYCIFKLTASSTDNGSASTDLQIKMSK